MQLISKEIYSISQSCKGIIQLPDVFNKQCYIFSCGIPQLRLCQLGCFICAYLCQSNDIEWM